MHLPVDDVSTNFKCSAIPRSPALMHLLDHTSAAQGAAGVSRLLLHAFVHLLRAKDCLAVGQRGAHTIADRVRFFTRERENVGQEGFDALVHRVFLNAVIGRSELAQGGW